ncbi:MAG TPA: hypothetical protein VJI13_03480 [Candidatus Norongarragalinales archaeon]|nr:hypothetical protein [Candidatus Norongarragalinales archaeon]
MLILGFESTAHTFGAAVVESSHASWKKSNSPKTRQHPHAGKSAHPSSNRAQLAPNDTKIISETDSKYPSLKEGFIPRKLADFHSKNFDGILDSTLAEAGISLSDLDAVCYSYGPGIGHSLHIGYMAAKSISVSRRIPLVPVNHALAHIEIARFHSGFKDPLAIYVSGGNTQILVLENLDGPGILPSGDAPPRNANPYHSKTSCKHYRILGETLDIGLGNYLDQVGRSLGLSPPDAVGVLKKAAEGKNLLPLPYIVKGMNTSYSGMLTAVRKLCGGGGKNIAKGKNLRSANIPDICLSAQEYAFSMLLETAERALTLTKKKEIVGVGGNYRNKRLSEMTSALAKEHGIKCHFPSFGLLGDNAGMIAVTGAMQFASGCYSQNPEPNQKARVDGETVCW